MMKILLGLLSLFLGLDLVDIFLLSNLWLGLVGGLGFGSLGRSFRLDLGGGRVLSLGRSRSVGSGRVGGWGIGNVAGGQWLIDCTWF